MKIAAAVVLLLISGGLHLAAVGLVSKDLDREGFSTRESTNLGLLYAVIMASTTVAGVMLLCS